VKAAAIEPVESLQFNPRALTRAWWQVVNSNEGMNFDPMANL
jgi:hypothetical protein